MLVLVPKTTLLILKKQGDNIDIAKGGLMKLISPFTILNKKFHEMDFIREAMKDRKLVNERLKEDYRNIYKPH